SALRARGEPTGADELVVHRQVWPTVTALLCTAHVFPTPVRQESMVAARDELCPILQDDPVGGLDRRPMRDDLRPGVVVILLAANCAVDLIADSHIGESLC